MNRPRHSSAETQRDWYRHSTAEIRVMMHVFPTAVALKMMIATLNAVRTFEPRIMWSLSPKSKAEKSS
ncbi:hypothetical protein ACROYT_G032686 [Oculina patagonica]